MEKIITLNNEVHSWLDDNETTKLAVLISLVLIASIGPSAIMSGWAVLTILPLLVGGISRWHYIVKGKYVGKR